MSIYPVKVNDDEFEMRHQLVVAHDILELAEKNHILTGKPADYYLQSRENPEKQFRNDDEVDLEKDNWFLALLNTPTPVA